MDKNLRYFTNIHHALMLDEEGADVSSSIIRSVFRKLYIHHSWESDCRQEIIAAWLKAPYDIRRPRKDILSYATRAAILACLEWRRSVLTVIYCNRKMDHEPVSVSLDALHGEDLDRYIEATCKPDPSIQAEEGYDPYAEDEEDDKNKHKLSDIQIPSKGDPKDYEDMLKLLASGHSKAEVAKMLGTTSRTIHRRLERLANLNRTARDDVDGDLPLDTDDSQIDVGAPGDLA